MARKKSKPHRPASPWETDGATGTKDARGRPLRAPLARGPVTADTIETRAVDPGTGRDVTARERIWRRRGSPIVEALPEADRAALAHYADLVGRIGASAGTLDPTGQGGTPSTPTGPSLSRLAAAEGVRRVRHALAGHAVTLDRFGRAMAYQTLVDLLAVEEVSPNEVARRIERTPTGRPSRPAIAGVRAATADAAALVAAALGHRDGGGAK